MPNKISDIQPLNKLMCLFKGEPKSGKSTAAATFPEPIYFIDCDLRLAPLAQNPITKDRNVEFDSFTSFQPLWNRLEELQRYNPYATVVFDSLTSLGRILMSFLLDNRGKSKEIKDATDKEKEGKSNLSIGGIPILGIAEYGAESSALSQVMTKLRIIREHGCNTILIAHVITTDTTNLSGISRVSRRILTGGNKIASEIPSYFDEVYHFSVDKPLNDGDLPQYKVHTVATGSDFAGTSLFGLPAQIDWTNKSLYDEIRKSIESK
jgi:AAA domain